MPWKRILYENQHYKDNYYDPNTFLNQLKVVVNESNKFQTFFQYIKDASILVTQLSIVALFLTTYKLLLYKYIAFSQLVQLNFIILFFCCFVIYHIEKSSEQVYQQLKIFIISAICLRIASPIIITLTHSFSLDTIHALAITFSALHLVFHDYLDSSHENNLSLNAAIFSAIILASRLSEIDIVVAFITLALVSFSLLPKANKLLHSKNRYLSLLLTIFLWIVTSCSIYRLGMTLLAVYEIIILLFWIIGPVLLSKMQSLKRAFSGPWDILFIPEQ